MIKYITWCFFRSITDYEWRDVVKPGQRTESAPTTKIYFLLFI